MTTRAKIGAAGSALALTAAAPMPATAQTEPFIGQLALFGFNFCPRFWAPADGRLLAINRNQALFALLGTQYGGDGRTTFALPDLRGRAAIGTGRGPGLAPYRIGQSGGSEQVTLEIDQLPTHSHAATTEVDLPAPSAATATDGHGEDVVADVGDGATAAPAGRSVTTGEAVTATTTVAATGGGQPHENRAPYLVANWCIALQGVFPPRN